MFETFEQLGLSYYTPQALTANHFSSAKKRHSGAAISD